MTPFAKLIFLAVIGLLILVLVIRIGLRWYRDRQALASTARPPYRPDRRPTAAADMPMREPLRPAADPRPPVDSIPSTPSVSQTPEFGTILREESARNETPVSASQATMVHEIAHSAATKPSLYRPSVRNENAAMTASYDAEDMPFADKSDYSFGAATPMLAAMLPESPEKRLAMKRSLKNAGYYTPHAWHNLAATRYIGLVLPIILFGALLIMVPPRFEWPIIGCLIAFPILGYALPGLLVQSQASARIRDIEGGMPDMLDMLNMCVSQGMTLPASLQRVGHELRGVYPDLSKELAIVSDQSRIAGLPQALESFADRVDSPDVHSFTSLLVQTERMGTSVSGALSDYSENMREGLRQRADLKGNSATFKLLFPTVLCLMPAVFLFLLGPAIVQLHDFYTSGGTQILRNDANAVIQSQAPER